MKTKHDVMPSISFVQTSCMMALNNLLSVLTGWNPIIPDRRHSDPSSQSTIALRLSVDGSASALKTLVSNLRNLDPDMVESHLSDSESDLTRELDARIQSSSAFLKPPDAALARALVSLLSHFNRLSGIRLSAKSEHTRIPGLRPCDLVDPTGRDDVFDMLKQRLTEFQLERINTTDSMQPGSSPVLAIESALLWSRIDEDLENVLSMCKERVDGLPRFPSYDHLPPQYDQADYDFDTPPQYELGSMAPAGESKSSMAQSESSSHSATQNEKTRLDLESISVAIDRLYRVTPQLHDQRVELKGSKIEQLNKARLEGGTSFSPPSSEQRRKDISELETILEMIEKASDRKLSGQTVSIDAGTSKRLEKSRIRDQE